MIVDSLQNYELYANTYAGFAEAFEFLKKFMENELPVGRYEIDGNNVYALVQAYDTIPEKEGKWEGHREYIDLQFIAKGKEIIGWANIQDLVPGSYNAEKDVIFFEGQEGTDVKLAGGQFAILYPEDIHKPKCIWGSAQPVKKVVVKIKV